MKKITHIIILSAFLICLIAFNSTAQSSEPLKKGKQYVGLSLSGGWGGYYGFIGNVGGRYGYYLKDRFAIGSELFYGGNGWTYQEFKPGIYVKYHFSDKKVSPFIETGFYTSFVKQYKDNTSPWENTNYNEGRVGVGMHVQNLIGNKISFESILGYSTHNDGFLELRFLYNF